jgi:hypothetical protein
MLEIFINICRNIILKLTFYKQKIVLFELLVLVV